MIDLKKAQKEILQNKINKGFNTTDIYKEFCLIHEEVSEACRSYYRKQDDTGEEIADVMIYILGLSEILGLDLEKEILKKMAKNQKREYRKIKGVTTRVKDV
jgi:NTP pyrophosphatase (non-canonical NTP hydrolase)